MKRVVPLTLQGYYEKQFPWNSFFSFVTCEDHYDISQRVFWFVHEKFTSKRCMFRDKIALKRYILHGAPKVIGIGIIWPYLPDFHGDCEKITFSDVDEIEGKRFLEREVILDVDMNDYENVRIGTVCECGSERKCCNTCWIIFIRNIAFPYVKYVLEDLWQFKKILRVFSGRRGIHIHIQDQRVMTWTLQQRCVFKRDCLDSMVGIPRQHQQHLMETLFLPTFRRFFAMVSLEDCPVLLGELKAMAPVKETLGGAKTIGALVKYMKRFDQNWENDVAWYCLRPRFDPGFFRDLTHIVKTPWGIHKDTRRICSVIENTDEFLPENTD